VEIATGQSAEEVLLKAFDISTECYSLRFNNAASDLVALFGITPAASLVARIGVPWMLCTSEVSRGAIAIAREAPRWLNKWAREYGLLRNIVYLCNSLHGRWLHTAGCQFDELVQINGHPFLLFSYQESKQCVIQSQSSLAPH
jgi:hypothetical protein